MNGTFIINGNSRNFTFPSDATLLQVLRENGYSEVKEGCNQGECGACLILLDDELVNSCQVLAGSAIGHKITTIKGIGDIHNPHIIQDAFVESGAVQCGFCTPGMVMATYYLLQKNPMPDDNEIKLALSGNLCRCTGYVKIIQAVKLAAERIRNEG
ncbi:(2Fe-2S)-binding protein [bacterium]|nr:MAG: (2Fe-2S)-binding protein [bacterium]